MVERIDPAPRRYPAAVTLVRRVAHGPAVAPQQTTLEAVETWLLGDALRERDQLLLFESLVWRLAAAGLPLDRASLHIGTLHPQAYGFAWNWLRIDGICDEVRVSEAALQSDSYRRNPLHRVIERGEAVRRVPQEAAAEFPLMAELARDGMTDYAALPLGAGDRMHNAMTVATRRPGGFTEAEFATIRRLLALFALHVERHIAWRIAGNVLDAYLGQDAGGRVLQGAIKRGAGQPIDAIIWVSDLRGFTTLSDRLAAPDMIQLLNAYFERIAGAVIAHGGEVLKFIGDGLLAVFPLRSGELPAEAAEAALAAAEAALAEIEALNAAQPAPLDSIEGWRPLRSGIALHEGQVFFGNIGAPERLDFTVIGPAVNEASRVEALTKELGRAILITEPVARRLARPLDDLGRHSLRGVAAPVAIFSPPQR
jgi:adenylate cyclase